MQILNATIRICRQAPSLLFWLIVALFATDRAEAITEPGTVITNQAALTYVDADTGKRIELVSNLSTITVSPYFNFSIHSRHDVFVVAGQQTHLSHQISNDGNVADRYNLDVSADTGVEAYRVVRDANKNGLADLDETTPVESLRLNPGEKVDLVIVVSVSREAQPGDVYGVGVTATSVDGSQVTAQNTINIEVGLALSLLKSVSIGCHTALFPGDALNHEIDILNSGSSAVTGVRLLLNAERVDGVVVEQPLVQGLRFSNIEYDDSDASGQAVVRLQGVAENSWVSVDEWDGVSAIDSAGVLYTRGKLPPQSRDFFRVATVVDQPDRELAVVSTAAVADTNGDRIPDYESNRTCHQFSVPSGANAAIAELDFVEPAPAVRNRGAVADFYTNSDFIAASQYTLDANGTPGYLTDREGVYLELSLSPDLLASSSIKYDRNNQRFIEVRLESTLTDDHVFVLLLETGTAGLFRSIAPVRLSDRDRANGSYCPAGADAGTVLKPDFTESYVGCVLGSSSADELQATYLDTGLGFAIAEASLVNPQALVFNAQTGLPVADAVVRFRFAATDALVIDRITGLPYEVTTGARGLYTMPRLEPFNEYYIDVETPAAHVFPSTVAARTLPAFNVVPSSYGRNGFLDTGSGSFFVEPGGVPDPIDVPVDSNVSDMLLMVEKNVSTSEVEIGGVVNYSVVVKNTDARVLSSVVLRDKPPYGYRYVPLSTTLNGEVLADPQTLESGELQFDLGTFEPAQVGSITYALRVSAAAVDSDGINEAMAVAVNEDNAQIISPVSRVQTRVNRFGVLSDRAALFGKVYVDQNCNAVQDAAEWPVGGVRLYLQDGTYTLSDADGSYSLYGLAPGSHVVKVDSHTLPAGLKLKPLDSLQAADPDSRFVELVPGDFHRVDFAAVCPDPTDERLLSEIKARNAMLNDNWLLQEAERFRADEELPGVSPEQRVRSIDGDLSNGRMHGPIAEEDGTVTASVSPEVIKKIVASQNPVATPLPDPKKLVSEITSAQAKAGTWVWPQDEISTRGRFMAVVRDGIEPTLYVNGSAVAASHIGERLANRREKAQIVAWYGVELNDGENELQVRGVGPFGNERVLASGSFKKPSSGASIRLHTDDPTIQADGGRSTIPVKIAILDKSGYPALGVYFVTLESSDGGFVEQDIQDSEPGVQVRVSNGERIVHFVSSSTTGAVRLIAGTGEFKDEIEIQQVSESRPLVAVGLLEAGVGFHDNNFGDFAPSRPLNSPDSGVRLDSRAALFAKGRVKDRFNLTLSYDSGKDSDSQLMRDINPAAHYPIHGDASIRGYDAQSRSKLYVKLEEGKNSIMWGDFLTDSGTDHEDLARTRRTLTGFNSVVDSDYGRFRFFASRQEDTFQTEEFPGNGSAMLYRLETYPIVPNSEVVELVTRSRDNPGIVIARSRLSRFGDYTIDPVLGFISFSSVIPTIDDQQNPVSVQVSYDLESNGSNYWVTGLRFDRGIGDNIQLGFSHTSDTNSQLGVDRSGAYVTFQPGDNTEVKVSLAGSTSAGGDRGQASRVTVDHQWAKGAETSFTYARADQNFNNNGASIASGRVEARLNHKQSISQRTTASIDVLHSESLASTDSRTSFGGQIESRLRNWLVRAGLRQVTQEDLSGSDDYVTAILGANRQFTLGDRSGRFNAELEQDTGRASRRRLSVGGKLQVHEHAHVYTNYELSNSLLALAAASNNQKTEVLTLGVESDLLPQTRIYSEYRMRGAFDSRDYETASGIRGDYEIKPEVRISPSIELIQGDEQGDSVAASVAVTDLSNANSRRLLRVETRHTEFSDYVGVRASYAARVNEDWTSVVTENFSRQHNTSGEDTLRHSLVAGFSRRPKLNNRHHMLLMYNWKEEKGVSPGLRRSVHLLSTHQNLQLDNRSVLSGRLGGKHQKIRLGEQLSSDFTVLADVRLNFDFNRRVNVDVHGGVLATDNLSEVRYSAGAGIYYVFNKNARVGVGYNFGGFADDDLDAESYHAHGLRFGFQYKFDEDSLKWLE
jgi:uncharacterized repeat protein (TIGR01451 family)